MDDDQKAIELIAKPALLSIFEAGKKSGQFFTFSMTFAIASLIIMLGIKSQSIQSEFVNFSIASVKIYVADSCWLFAFGAIALMYKSSSLRLVESTLYLKLLEHPLIKNNTASMVYSAKSFYFFPTLSNLFRILQNENFKKTERKTEDLHDVAKTNNILERALSSYRRGFSMTGNFAFKLYSKGVGFFVLILNFLISNMLRVAITIVLYYIISFLAQTQAKSIIGDYQYSEYISLLAIALIYILELNVFFTNKNASSSINTEEKSRGYNERFSETKT
jgi:hypothetical protein